MPQNVRDAAKNVTRWLVRSRTPEVNSLRNFTWYDTGEAVYVDQDDHIQNVALSLIALCGVATVSIACGHVAGNSNRLRHTAYVLTAVVCRNLTPFAGLSIAACSGFLSLSCLALGFLLLLQQWTNVGKTYGTDDTGDQYFLKPTLFPCRTKHTRIFPIRHSFSYSYLFVGVPVDWKGSVNSMLSTSSGRMRTWFKVHADDYLVRGNHTSSLRGKLNDYLTSQGVDRNQYPYAYLVTAPRFFGYSFNPVSFWYLYDEHKDLTAMILEVNNTFDERRMYFMLKESRNDGRGDTFTSQWSKDFHVSPFNDRDGSYSVKVKNLAESLHIDNNIVLRSEEGMAKIVARVFSTSVGIDPAMLSRTQRLSFIVRWWWVGFMTNPRILREARTLWTKKLQVFYRPEVLSSSIGRNETTEEISLQVLFRACLQELVDRSNCFRLHYTSAAGSDRGKLTVIEPESRASSPRSDIELQVMTPAFYNYLVRGMSLRDVFDKYCFNPSPKEAMVYASNAELLQQLLKHTASDDSLSTQGVKERAIALLRSGRSLNIISHGFMLRSSTNKWIAEASEFDLFVRKSSSPTAYNAYLNTALWILTADHFAFGLVTLLRTYILILWAVTLVLTASAASSMMNSIHLIYPSVIVSFGLFVFHMLGGLTTI